MSNVVLVGASNVGKSSIFNCLTNTKQAIISHIPGTTRDRIFGDFTYNENTYSLCDTGGLGDPALDFAEDLTTQTHIAISSADIIWFIVDGANEHPTQLDYELSRSLRATNKEVFLVINKMDLVKSDVNAFYELGFKSIHTISSRTQEGLNDLVEATTKFLPIPTHDPHDLCISIVGRPNVGKSTWLNALSRQKRFITSDQSGTTRDSSAIQIKHRDKKIRLIDTAGVQNKNKHKEQLDFYAYVRTMKSIHEADVVCLMLDAASGVVTQDKKLINELIQIGKPFFVLFNKSDLIEKKDRIEDFEGWLPNFIPIDYVSAHKRSGLNTFYKRLYELHDEANVTFSTNMLNNTLIKVTALHEPPMHQGRRTRLRYIHQIQQSPRVFKIHGKQTKKLQKSYIRYLENGFRKHLSLNHLPIRFFFKDDENPYI